MDNTNNIEYLAGRKLINYGSRQEPWFSVTEIMEHCRLNLILINDLLEYVDSNNKKKVYSRSIENQEKVQLWIMNTSGAVEMLENVERAVSNKFMEIMTTRILKEK